MKRLISVIILSFGFFLFAESYKATVKGEVYLKTSEGEMVQLKEEDSVTDEDTIIVGDKSGITIIIEGNKIVIRTPGVYKVKDLK